MNTTVPVSVIIPCYRCASTIERAILSVIAQTARPAELIFVDDASPGGTPEILTSLVRSHSSWMRLVQLPANQGAANARNIAWDLATQPYIAFLDADDAWHPEKIAVQYGYMKANPDVVLSGHGHRELTHALLPQWEIISFEVRTIRKSALLLRNKFVTPSVMVRRDVPQRFVAQQRYMEDHMLWLAIACDGLKMTRLEVALAAIYKPIYGSSGLSANLWPMQRAELGNYWRLYRENKVSIYQIVPLFIYSIIKYLRRVLIYSLYLRWL